MTMTTKTMAISTTDKTSFHDITDTIKHFVAESNIKQGIVHIFVPHTTAAVTINENADPTVQVDLERGLNRAFPDDKAFKHLEGNSDAHLKSSAIGVSEQVLIIDGSLQLGLWQGIYFCEFDGPRDRRYLVSIQG